MIDCIYVVDKKKLYIHCEIEEYCKRINNWMAEYRIVYSKNYDSYIKIYKDKTIWNINEIEKSINGRIQQTDLYPLVYNAIANLVLNNINILLHSSVLWYNNIGILVIGDFNSGKTTLCLKSIDNNIKVLSADQTLLYFKNNKLLLKQGSSYMKIDDNNEKRIMIKNSRIEIKYIVNIVGMCDGGKVLFKLIKDKNHVIKKLFKFCTWHSDIPLFTNSIVLDIDRIRIYELLNKINLPFYDVRGDSEQIIIKIKEELK